MPLVRTVRTTRDTEDVFLCHTSFYLTTRMIEDGCGLSFSRVETKAFFRVSQLSQKVYLEWSTLGRKKCFVFLGTLFSPSPHKPASQKHCWCSKSDSPILSSLSGTLCAVVILAGTQDSQLSRLRYLARIALSPANHSCPNSPTLGYMENSLWSGLNVLN